MKLPIAHWLRGFCVISCSALWFLAVWSLDSQAGVRLVLETVNELAANKNGNRLISARPQINKTQVHAFYLCREKIFLPYEVVIPLSSSYLELMISSPHEDNGAFNKKGFKYSGNIDLVSESQFDVTLSAELTYQCREAEKCHFSSSTKEPSDSFCLDIVMDAQDENRSDWRRPLYGRFLYPRKPGGAPKPDINSGSSAPGGFAGADMAYSLRPLGNIDGSGLKLADSYYQRQLSVMAHVPEILREPLAHEWFQVLIENGYCSHIGEAFGLDCRLMFQVAGGVMLRHGIPEILESKRKSDGTKAAGNKPSQSGDTSSSKDGAGASSSKEKESDKQGSHQGGKDGENPAPVTGSGAEAGPITLSQVMENAHQYVVGQLASPSSNLANWVMTEQALNQSANHEVATFLQLLVPGSGGHVALQAIHEALSHGETVTAWQQIAATWLLYQHGVHLEGAGWSYVIRTLGLPSAIQLERAFQAQFTQVLRQRLNALAVHHAPQLPAVHGAGGVADEPLLIVQQQLSFTHWAAQLLTHGGLAEVTGQQVGEAFFDTVLVSSPLPSPFTLTVSLAGDVSDTILQIVQDFVLQNPDISELLISPAMVHWLNLHQIGTGVAPTSAVTLMAGIWEQGSLEVMNWLMLLGRLSTQPGFKDLQRFFQFLLSRAGVQDDVDIARRVEILQFGSSTTLPQAQSLMHLCRRQMHPMLNQGFNHSAVLAALVQNRLILQETSGQCRANGRRCAVIVLSALQYADPTQLYQILQPLLAVVNNPAFGQFVAALGNIAMVQAYAPEAEVIAGGPGNPGQNAYWQSAVRAFPVLRLFEEKHNQQAMRRVSGEFRKWQHQAMALANLALGCGLITGIEYEQVVSNSSDMAKASKLRSILEQKSELYGFSIFVGMLLKVGVNIKMLSGMIERALK